MQPPCGCWTAGEVLSACTGSACTSDDGLLHACRSSVTKRKHNNHQIKQFVYLCTRTQLELFGLACMYARTHAHTHTHYPVTSGSTINILYHLNFKIQLLIHLT